MKTRFDWQWIAVLLLFGAAVIYLVRMLRKGNASSGCGGDSCNCSPGHKAG